RSVTTPVPRTSASGTFRCGFFTSPATAAIWFQPSYVQRTPTIATPNADAVIGNAGERGADAAAAGDGASAPKTTRPTIVATIRSVKNACTRAPSLTPT